MKASLNEFCAYLEAQSGQPYLWGGQHTKLTPQNYVEVINRMESSPEYIKAVEKFCAKAFKKGATVLYAYDCSGLGMYFLQNLKKVYTHDMSADSLMRKCEMTDEPKRGYWVFRLSGETAVHIGYMVSDKEVIHAKGRAYGVVKERYKKSYWHAVGIPSCIDFAVDPMFEIAVRGSVRVREGNGVLTKKICTVHNCRLPYLGTANESPNWYMTEVNGKRGYITSNPRYTSIVEAVR